MSVEITTKADDNTIAAALAHIASVYADLDLRKSLRDGEVSRFEIGDRSFKVNIAFNEFNRVEIFIRERT